MEDIAKSINSAKTMGDKIHFWVQKTGRRKRKEGREKAGFDTPSKLACDQGRGEFPAVSIV